MEETGGDGSKGQEDAIVEGLLLLSAPFGAGGISKKTFPHSRTFAKRDSCSLATQTMGLLPRDSCVSLCLPVLDQRTKLHLCDIAVRIITPTRISILFSGQKP